MKTSALEVHAMLSVLSADEVERRIGEAPGVESATVNWAAGSATVRYETKPGSRSPISRRPCTNPGISQQPNRYPSM